jgi:hypothetical protein
MTTRKTIFRQHHVSHSALRNGRDRCIETLRRVGAGSGANCFFDKAMILLTRCWAETPWRGRAELLQTAEWLIRVGAHGSPPENSHARYVGNRLSNRNEADPDRLKQLSGDGAANIDYRNHERALTVAK